MDVDPLSVILVKSDSKGDRLLFRYPYEKNKRPENGQQHRKKNPYALILTEDVHSPPPPQKLSTEKDYLANFADDILSNLFAVKQELCETKFELKVNDVRFVGHPIMVQPCSRRGKCGNRPIILINIVFALHATANHSIVKCYYELSKRFGVALRHEERRCGYVYQEVKNMIAAHDDFGRPEEGVDLRNPFEVILETCSLAKDLKAAYNALKSSGLVELRINRWISVSFCLPQKVHRLHNRALTVEPEAIDRCLENIRPYHGLLLLSEASELIEKLAPDASPALIRLLKIYTPLKSLQTLSADADLTLTHVFEIASHLVYWGKAIFIYPLCESNVYMSAPGAPVHSRSPLVEKFAEQFPGHSLIQVMSEFSLPTTVRHKVSPLQAEPHRDVQIIIWLLQQRLLIQLHTYIYYMPTSKGIHPSFEEMSSSEETGRSSSDETSDTTLMDGWSGQLEEDCLRRLPPAERSALVSSSPAVEQVRLLVRLILLDFLQGEHHIEEIMYTQNLRRSQIMQLLDKFRDVLVTCEAQDPALAIFYPQ